MKQENRDCLIVIFGIVILIIIFVGIVDAIIYSNEVHKKIKQEDAIKESAYKISQNEIRPHEYRTLLNHTLKYPSFRHIIGMKLDDCKISNQEFDELERLYNQMSVRDSVSIFLHEKSYVDAEKRED